MVNDIQSLQTFVYEHMTLKFGFTEERSTVDAIFIFGQMYAGKKEIFSRVR